MARERKAFRRFERKLLKLREIGISGGLLSVDVTVFKLVSHFLGREHDLHLHGFSIVRRDPSAFEEQYRAEIIAGFEHGASYLRSSASDDINQSKPA